MKYVINPFKYVILMAGALALFVTCTNDDHFGRSDFNEIKAFTVPGQSGATVISKTNSTVTLTVAKGVDRTSLVPSTFEISNFATVTPGKTVARDFTDPVEYVVRAENDSKRIWTVTIDEIGENPQLSNSDFDLWYETSAGIINPMYYEEPGESKDNTIWATANYGLTNYGFQPNATPFDFGSDNYAVHMETVPAPIVGLAAGTIYTGVFKLDIANPAASARFGIPFTSRPAGFRVNYVYVPETDPANLVGVDYDECDIYVLLEKREGDAVERIATGWFRDGTETGTDSWTSLEVNLKYGPLSASDPEYAYANIKGSETWGDPNDTPTHISVIFSSSALGNEYKGAIGSILVVDDFELIYE